MIQQEAFILWCDLWAKTPSPGAPPQSRTIFSIVQKVFSEKASAIARMRQKCVRNASEMRQKCVKNASEMRQNGSCFIGKRGTSKMRQKSVKIASKMRGTPLGENTFWTIPKFYTSHHITQRNKHSPHHMMWHWQVSGSFAWGRCRRCWSKIPLSCSKLQLFAHSPRIAIPLACYRIGFGPPARNRKKIGKI